MKQKNAYNMYIFNNTNTVELTPAESELPLVLKIYGGTLHEGYYILRTFTT